MGLYQISVKEPSGHHICGFEYWVIANGSEIAKGNLNSGGPTDVNLKGLGSGDLYIRGPALKGYWDPANPKAGRNFAHRERIELTGQGEIEFLLEPSPDALGILPKKPCSGAQTFCSPEGCSIEIPPVPVQFRALNDPQNPNHPGYVFRCEFHDAMPLTRWIAVASGGNGERLWLPSGAVTLNIYYALNDGNNQPVPGTEQRQTATLRKGDQAMGYTLLMNTMSEPGIHTGFFDAPNEVEWRGWDGINHGWHPPRFIVQNPGDKHNASFNASIWKQSRDEGIKQVQLRYPDAKNIRLLALSNSSFPLYEMADKGGNPGYHWLTYHWSKENGRGEQFVEHGLMADKVFMEWEL